MPHKSRRPSSSVTPLAASCTGATGNSLVASAADRIPRSALATSTTDSTALATSALRFLGGQRKAHHPDQAGNKQNLEVFHDAPFNLADISARIL